MKQRSYYKSSVLDLDVPADHMIFGTLYEIANKFNIKYILSGKNIVTEAVLPKAWNYDKFDLINLRDIHKSFDNGSLDKLPALGLWQSGYYTGVKRIQTIELLNYVDYNKQAVKELLKKELDWRDYGGKHYENIFTRFYQSYLLPVKFGIDKRKAHLSNLIFSNQIAKDEALKELSNLPYDANTIMQDMQYVSKKLGFSMDEFISIINQPNRLHSEFKTDHKQKNIYSSIIKFASPFTSMLYKLKVLKR